MRIALIDCASNVLDAFDAFTKMSEEVVAGAQVERLTASDLLKIPLCTKKMFSGGSDIAIVFLTLTGNDLDAMALVHEKVIDVELVTEKYILFCIVSDDEYHDNSGLEALVTERLRTVLTLASQLELSPSQVSGAIGDPKIAAELSALSGFASMMSQDPLGVGEPAGSSDAGSSGNDDVMGKSLF